MKKTVQHFFLFLITFLLLTSILIGCGVKEKWREKCLMDNTIEVGWERKGYNVGDTIYLGSNHFHILLNKPSE